MPGYKVKLQAMFLSGEILAHLADCLDIVGYNTSQVSWTHVLFLISDRFSLNKRNVEVFLFHNKHSNISICLSILPNIISMDIHVPKNFFSG